MAAARVSAVEWIGLALGVGSAYGAWSLWRASRKDAAVETEDEMRANVVSAARGELGKARLDVYFADAAPQFVGSDPEWCGIFALWALHQAGLGRAAQWKTGLGFLEVDWKPQGLPKLKRTTEPRPGDIAYFTKFQHQAIVEKVADGQVHLLNGNGAGGVVSASSRPVTDAAAYYSIQPWIDAARAASSEPNA